VVRDLCLDLVAAHPGVVHEVRMVVVEQMGGINVVPCISIVELNYHAKTKTNQNYNSRKVLVSIIGHDLICRALCVRLYVW
jgi:hypothetical protein